MLAQKIFRNPALIRNASAPLRLKMSIAESLSIYFCGSIQGGRDDADTYRQLIDVLKTYGSVPTASVGDEGVAERDKKNDPERIYKRNMAWFRDADVVVAEVTQPSLGVGYEMGWASILQKPTLCLFRTSCGRRLSCMIAGGVSDTFQVRNYTEVDQAVDIIKNFFKTFKKGEHTSVPSLETSEARSASDDMSIYFCGSVQGGRGDASIYKELISLVRQYGKVPTEDVGNENVVEEELKKMPQDVYKKCMDGFRASSAAVAEVTQPSLGVGYEMAWAVKLQKPAMCLFRTNSGQHLSAMIAGATSGTSLQVETYTEVEQALAIAKNFLDTKRQEYDSHKL